MRAKKFNFNINLINFRPMMFIAISLAIGIVLSYLYIFNEVAIFFILVSLYAVSIVCFIIFSKKANRKINLIFVIIFIMFFLVGYFMFNSSLADYKNASLGNLYLKVNGRVIETTVADNSQKIVLENVSVSGAVKKNLDYNVNVYVVDGDFSVGDYLSYTSYLYDYDYLYSGDFSSGFISENIKYYSIVDASDISLFGNSKNIFEHAKYFIVESLSSGMSGEEYQVAYSLLLGGSDVIDDEVISSFRNTGVAHIFAVSGLHIGFLAMVLSFVFSKIKLKKIIKSVLTILILFFYSGICGFSASSIRAVIMASILLLSINSGRKYDMLSSVSFAFFVIVLFKPIQLFCVGFQLSFSAVLGILLLSKKVNKVFSFLPEKISSLLSTSISAQIMTLPFLLNYFNRVSFISVFVNVIFIPLVSVLFIGLFSLAIIGGIFSISNVTLFIPKCCIKAFIFAIRLFDSEIFLISIIVTSLSIVIYYISVLYLSDLLNFKKLIRGIVCSVFAVTFIAYSIIYYVNLTAKIKITVSANTTLYCTTIDCDDEKTLIISKFSDKNSLTRLQRDLEEKEKIKNIIILDKEESKSALYTLIYLLYDQFTLSKIYLPMTEEEILIVQNVFKSIEIISLDSIQSLTSNNLKIEVNKNKSFVIVSGKNRNIVVMGNSNSSTFYDYSYTKNCSDLLVAYENEEVFANFFNSINTVTYNISTRYYSAKSNGNYYINL